MSALKVFSVAKTGKMDSLLDFEQKSEVSLNIYVNNKPNLLNQ